MVGNISNCHNHSLDSVYGQVPTKKEPQVLYLGRDYFKPALLGQIFIFLLFFTLPTLVLIVLFTNSYSG